VVCPEQHTAAGEIMATIRESGLVPLEIADEFAQLPHLVRLLAPRAVVSVRCAHAGADAAVARRLALGQTATRFIAFTTFGVDAGELDARFAGRVDGVEGLRATLAELGRTGATEADRRRMAELLEGNRAELTQMRARVIALSPKATLRRGYAVVIGPDGTAVRAPDQARGQLTVYVEHGSFGARAVPDGG
jgi:hypothetical protein